MPIFMLILYNSSQISIFFGKDANNIQCAKVLLYTYTWPKERSAA